VTIKLQGRRNARKNEKLTPGRQLVKPYRIVGSSAAQHMMFLSEALVFQEGAPRRGKSILQAMCHGLKSRHRRNSAGKGPHPNGHESESIHATLVQDAVSKFRNEQFSS
jgi:hypothetical protein